MSLSVLVVDDEPLVATSVEAFLEDEGMRVVSVGSAEAALDLVRAAGRFDVCVMDMRLPGMDGNAAILGLHALCPSLRFVIHTGSANYALPEAVRGIGAGDIPVFRKPLRDMGPMAETIRSLAEAPPGWT